MIEGAWIFDTEWTSHRERIAKKIRKAMKYYNERPDPKLPNCSNDISGIIA